MSLTFFYSYQFMCSYFLALIQNTEKIKKKIISKYRLDSIRFPIDIKSHVKLFKHYTSIPYSWEVFKEKYNTKKRACKTNEFLSFHSKPKVAWLNGINFSWHLMRCTYDFENCLDATGEGKKVANLSWKGILNVS